MTAAEITPFTFPETGQPVRTVLAGGQPWFVAADVCAVLRLTQVSAALRGLDDDERGVTEITAPNGAMVQVNTVSEPGLYSLIVRSYRTEAKRFRRWVTHDVLPAIRQTGRYEVAPRELTRLELIELARDAEVGRLAAEQKVAELEPSAQAWNTLAEAKGDYSVREAAFILNRDPGISTGQNRLFEALRDLKLIDGRDTPYAAHADRVRLRTYTYTDQFTGEDTAGRQVRITATGLKYLHGKLGGIRPLRTGDQGHLFSINGSQA